MNYKDIKSLLIVPKLSIDYVLDAINEEDITISPIKPFENIINKNFVYDMATFLVKKMEFYDMAEVSQYIDSKEVTIFFCDSKSDFFKTTDIIFIDLVNNNHSDIHINLF